VGKPLVIALPTGEVVPASFSVGHSYKNLPDLYVQAV
jgi:hypothetical protein